MFTRLGGRGGSGAIPVRSPGVLVRFEHVRRRQDLHQLVRWQVKKTAPLPPDGAQMGYRPDAARGDGHD